MRRNTKICNAIISVLAAAMCISCLCSCNLFNSDRIVELYFVSCTTPHNALYLNGYYQFDEALELAHEIEAIPDPVSTEGVCSYVIRISYIEDGVSKSAEKTGYNTFPDNWDRIVELINIIPNSSKRISNSRELAVIDADYLAEHNCTRFRYIVMPDDMTWDEILDNVNITYLTLYSPDSYASPDYRVEQIITDYLYDYYDLRSHQIEKLDDNPAKSTADEMKEFAESRFDKIDWDNATEYSCSGSYKGEWYVVVRYDMVQTWLEKESERYEKCGFTGSNCQYQYQIPPWEFGASAVTCSRDVFVDGSGKYLILTDIGDRRKPDNIAVVIK